MISNSRHSMLLRVPDSIVDLDAMSLARSPPPMNVLFEAWVLFDDDNPDGALKSHTQPASPLHTRSAVLGMQSIAHGNS